MRTFLFFILIVFSISAFAQFEEHFTDGGFGQNPHWDTLSPSFKVVNQVLNLQGIDNSGRAAIVTVDTVGPSAEWSIYLRLGFNPSVDDYVQVVMVSDQMDIRNDFNGYFIKIGSNGASDGLEFYKKEGNNEILIRQMMVAQFANGADGNLKVVKNNLGKWWFYWKNHDQTNYVAVDSLVDGQITTSSYFGMVCNYTLASKDSFWFDDIYSIRMPLLDEDTTAPTVLTAEIINSTQIDISFSEPLDALSVAVLSNYTLSTVGNPIQAVLDVNDKTLVHLYFSNRFSSNTNYTLNLQGIKDSVGNEMLSTQINLSTPYYAVANDIVVNEIMIKPTSSFGLPDKQYIELKNTTNNTIRLKNYRINNTFINDGYILPNNYLIVCPAVDTNLFSPFGSVVGVNSWTTLTNDGAISLRTDDNILVDSLNYVDTMYHNSTKQLGGWSLELLPTGYQSGCSGDLFWNASNNVNGGTPGSLNSTQTTNTIAVNATYELTTNNTIEIDFQYPMDSVAVKNISNYILDNGITIQNIVLLNNYASKAKLTLSSNLQENIPYVLIVKAFSGCLDYTHLADTFEIAITEIPQANEIIINEILFQPNASGVQFVEIYNTTNKLFKLKDIKITQADIITQFDVQVADLSNTRGYVYPNDYAVLTQNKDLVLNQYTNGILSKMHTINLPNYDEQQDICVLKNVNNETLDKLRYNVEWHFPLLTTTKGVSLERNIFTSVTQRKSSWHSAAQDVGYATPGYLNSDDAYNLLKDVHIIPEVFSPDGDGFDDEAKITYSFDDLGSVVNVYLYSSDGRLKSHLVQDEPIAKEGAFVWNGDDENGNKCAVGIYFMVFERKTPDGEKLIYKRKCVLAAKLN